MVICSDLYIIFTYHRLKSNEVINMQNMYDNCFEDDSCFEDTCCNPCCAGPRGPRGFRGEIGPTGATAHVFYAKPSNPLCL